ncbi:MAG: ester cyclase [Anaerolineae bacterium]|nr:ester cyclase [Anaerolineae bacterium]
MTFHVAAAQDDSSSYRDVVRVLIDQTYSYGTVDILDTVLAADYIRHPGSTDITGAKAGIVALRAAVPDLTASIDLLLQEDRYVVARFHMVGTFTQPFAVQEGAAVTPNNQPVQFVVNSIYRFNDDGLIAEEWNGFDNLTFLGQMGVIPTPASRPETVLNYPDLVMTGREIQNKAIVEDYFAAINSGDFSILDSQFKGDFQSHNPFGKLDRPGLAADWQRLKGALPDLTVSIDLLLSEGNWAAVVYTMRGTFSSSFVNANQSAIAPTGRSLELPVVILFRFEQEGLVAESWELYDSLSFLTQLGLLPSG